MKKATLTLVSFFILILLSYPVITVSGQTKGTFTDPRDKKPYKWVKIGKQVWMAENLNYKTLSGSGDYKDDPKARAIFGELYNFYAATKACPKGWHLPTNEEWSVLIDSLGGKDQAGSKLKQDGPTRWYANNYATNESGFTALPGGYRHFSNTFADVMKLGYFWTSSEVASDTAYSFYYCMTYSSAEIMKYAGFKTMGFSIRCLRDK